jgi:hypothetical protein
MNGTMKAARPNLKDVTDVSIGFAPDMPAAA